MQQLKSNLPYILLGVAALVVLAQLLGAFGLGLDQLVSDDIVGQLGHWLSGGATTVTVTGPLPLPEEQVGESSYVTVILFSVAPAWWNREAQVRERDAGQLLALLLDADGKAQVVSWGIDGLGSEGRQFALVLEHNDILTLRNIVQQLVRLPATEWLQPGMVFYGKSTEKREPGTEPEAVPGAKPTTSADTALNWAGLFFEQRSTDWFLLAGEKQAQLLGPRKETLEAAGLTRARTFNDIAGDRYDDLLVVEGLTMDEFGILRNKLRTHWEQKYVTDTRIYMGPQLTATQLLGRFR